MNYGLTLMAKGQYTAALDYFRRGETLLPNYYPLQINLAIANGASGNPAEAQPHFLRAIQLAPTDASAQFYFARWLTSVNRGIEAIQHLRLAVQFNPDYVAARYLLMESYAAQGNAKDLKQLAQETMARFPGDSTAASWLARASTLPAPALAAAVPPAPHATADDYITQSLVMYRAGKFNECITAAREALKLKPDYAEAWNNIGAAYNAMGQWDQGMAAEFQALRLKPDFQLAKNNLALAQSEKQKLNAAGIK